PRFVGEGGTLTEQGTTLMWFHLWLGAYHEELTAEPWASKSLIKKETFEAGAKLAEKRKFREENPQLNLAEVPAQTAKKEVIVRYLIERTNKEVLNDWDAKPAKTPWTSVRKAHEEEDRKLLEEEEKQRKAELEAKKKEEEDSVDFADKSEESSEEPPETAALFKTFAKKTAKAIATALNSSGEDKILSYDDTRPASEGEKFFVYRRVNGVEKKTEVKVVWPSVLTPGEEVADAQEQYKNCFFTNGEKASKQANHVLTALLKHVEKHGLRSVFDVDENSVLNTTAGQRLNQKALALLFGAYAAAGIWGEAQVGKNQP
ncbi:unnamed protein product, partial [Amoebophrya sp. A25]